MNKLQKHLATTILLLSMVSTLVLFTSCSGALSMAGSTSSGATIPASSNESTDSKYDALDNAQVKRIPDIGAAMDEILKAVELPVESSDTKWMGYNNFKSTFTLEDFEETKIGGYYAYSATLSNGIAVSSRVFSYADDGSDFVILDLKGLTDLEKIPVIEYDESKLADCWDIYCEAAQAK